MVVTAAAAAAAVGDVGVGDVDVEAVEHALGVGVNVDDILVEGRAVGNVVHAALALLLLQLEGDTAHVVTAAEAAHEVGHVTGDLVAHALGGRHGDVIDHL